MTLLAAWVGVDNKKNGPKPASLYIVSDSRISWGNGDFFDHNEKVFAMANHPDVLGFCGDVVFSSNILNQIVNQADSNILYPENASAWQKFEIIFERVKIGLNSYPKTQILKSFKIIYGTRDFSNDFHCFILSWSSDVGFSKEKLNLPNHSDLLTVEGSGKGEFLDKWHTEYDLSKHNNYRTSRAVYHCFTDTLDQIKDPGCGGAPQIAAIYRKDNARYIGIIKESKRYFMGNEIPFNKKLNFVEWRNDLFERYNAESLKITEAAQRQPK